MCRASLRTGDTMRMRASMPEQRPPPRPACASGHRGELGGGPDVDEVAVPELVHQQGPDPLRIAVVAGGVAVEHALDGVGLEVAPVACRAVEQDLARPLAQI